MKKRIIFVLVVFIMFLLPFIIISNHFSNTVSELSRNYVLLDMERGINSLSYRITSFLVNEFDIAKDLRDIKEKKLLISKINDISKKLFVKKISLYDFNGNLIYSTVQNEEKNVKNKIFEKSKNIDIPFGFISYPDDFPPQLNMIEKISNFILKSTLDLGYLNEMISSYSKKMIGHIYLIDSDGNIIFDSNYDFVFRSSRIDSEIIELINNLKSKGIFNYSGIIKQNQERYLISITNIETTTWWLFNKLEFSRADYPIFKSWVRRVIVSGILIIFSFSIITLLIFEKFFKK